MSDALLFSCTPKRWKQLVDDVHRAIGLDTLFKKSRIRGIVVETDGGPCRFAPDLTGEKPGKPAEAAKGKKG